MVGQIQRAIPITPAANSKWAARYMTSSAPIALRPAARRATMHSSGAGGPQIRDGGISSDLACARYTAFIHIGSQPKRAR